MQRSRPDSQFAAVARGAARYRASYFPEIAARYYALPNKSLRTAALTVLATWLILGTATGFRVDPEHLVAVGVLVAVVTASLGLHMGSLSVRQEAVQWLLDNPHVLADVLPLLVVLAERDARFVRVTGMDGEYLERLGRRATMALDGHLLLAMFYVHRILARPGAFQRSLGWDRSLPYQGRDKGAPEDLDL